MFETEDTLILRFSSGDEEAFTALAIKWRNHILNFAYQFLGDEDMVQDVLQEVLLRLYLSLKKFRGEAKFSTFLFRIITNCCIDTLRKERHKANEISLEDLSLDSDRLSQMKENTSNPGTETPFDIVNKDILGEKVRKALLELSENQRIVIIMREYSRMKFPEIAEVIGIPESTVKSRMYKGLMNLKKELTLKGIKDWSDI
ncbi:RNA polymerase sigma factor [Candidatus Latescibacterota bacterium]